MHSLHVSGFPVDLLADESILTSFEGALRAQVGAETLLECNFVRDRSTGRHRGFAFLSVLPEVGAAEVLLAINADPLQVEGLPPVQLVAQVAQQKKKKKPKKQRKGSAELCDIPRRKRGPSVRKHPESITCSADPSRGTTSKKTVAQRQAKKALR